MPESPTIINVNSYVWVRLTDEGREIRRIEYERARSRVPSLGPYRPLEEEFGFVHMMLWELMQLYGPHIAMGRVPPFGVTIFLTKPTGPDA